MKLRLEGMSRVLLCTLICLIVCLTGCGKSLEEQVSEQIELGQRYLTEMNYEEAIVAFSRAIELDEKNVDAYMGLGHVYENQAENMAQDSMDAGKLYELAAENYEKAQQLDPENSVIYECLIRVYKIMKNFEKLTLLLNGYSDTSESQLISDTKTAVGLIERIKELCIIGEFEQAFRIMQEEEYEKLSELVKANDNRLVILLENGKGIGFYQLNVMPMIYYGDYQDEIRQGHGIWFGGNENTESYQAEGEWAQDKPNGYQEERIGSDHIWVGNVKNGLWNGTITSKHLHQGEWEISDRTLTDGIYHILYEENGKYFVFDSGDRAIWTSNPSKVHGIRGFY